MQQSALLNVMVGAARKAARALKRDFGEVEHLQVSLKGPANFVTAADRRAEDTLKAELGSLARSAFQALASLRLHVGGDAAAGVAGAARAALSATAATQAPVGTSAASPSRIRCASGPR